MDMIRKIINILAIASAYIYILLLITMYIFTRQDFLEIPLNELILFTTLAMLVILDKNK